MGDLILAMIRWSHVIGNGTVIAVFRFWVTGVFNLQ